MRERAPKKDVKGLSETAQKGRLPFRSLSQLLLICFIGIYLLWFFSQPGSFGSSRLHDLVGLLLPDDLLRSTVGGGVEHLEVGALDRIPILFAAIAWLLVGFWIGRPVVLPFRQLVTRLEHTSLSLLIGLSLLSTATLMVGLAGLLHGRWLLIPVMALCWISLFLQRRISGRLKLPNNQAALLEIHRGLAQHVPNEELPGGQTARWLWRMLQVSTILLCVIYVLNAAMPPFEFDVVEYHLQGPKEFYQVGRIDFVPHNVYLNMPLGSEMHSLAAMVMIGGMDAWWSGALEGKLIIGGFSLIAAGLAAGFAARNYGMVAGWSAAALILASPGNIHVAGCGLVDSVLGAYILGTAIAIHCFAKSSRMQFIEKTLNSSMHVTPQAFQTWTVQSTTAAAWTACILAGAAVACKYTGLVFVWLPAVTALGWLALYANCRTTVPSVRRLALMIAIGFFVTGGPWLVKNLLYIGNPVFPLVQQQLGTSSSHWTDQQTDRWRKAHRTPDGPSFAGWEQPATPYSLPALLGGLHTIVVGSPMLPPTLIPFSILGMCLIRRQRSGGLLTDWLVQPSILLGLLLIWILAVWWLATHRIDRFWLPTVPLLAVLAGSAYAWAMRKVGLGVVAGLLLLSNIYGVYLGLTGALCDQRWLVSLDSLRRDQGTTELPGRIPKTTAWVNQNLPDNSYLLLIGEARAFDFLPRVSYATCFNTPPGEFGLKGKTGPEQLNWLLENGVTHVLINWEELSRYRSPGNYGFSSWPSRSDIEAMVTEGVLQTEPNWPFDSEKAILLKTGSQDAGLIETEEMKTEQMDNERQVDNALLDNALQENGLAGEQP